MASSRLPIFNHRNNFCFDYNNINILLRGACCSNQGSKVDVFSNVAIVKAELAWVLSIDTHSSTKIQKKPTFTRLELTIDEIIAHFHLELLSFDTNSLMNITSICKFIKKMQKITLKTFLTFQRPKLKNSKINFYPVGMWKTLRPPRAGGVFYISTGTALALIAERTVWPLIVVDLHPVWKVCGYSFVLS